MKNSRHLDWRRRFCHRKPPRLFDCGSGEPTLRYAISVDYQFQVTANSTTGTPYAQTVTLKLTIQ